jgi:hypothetical protein
VNAIPCISDYRHGDEWTAGPHALIEDYSLGDAQAEAADAMDRDPYSIAWWLGEHTPTANAPVDIGIVADRMDAGMQCTAAELLALAFNDSARAVHALHLLREMYRADPGVQRDAEILAAQLYEETNGG